MPLIDIPSVGVVEFPDSMSAQDIEKAIRENILKPKTTVGGYVKETLKAVPRGLVSGLEQAALGAAALLPGDTESGFEKTAREAIKGVAEKVKPTAAFGYEEAIPTKLGEAIGSMGSLLIPGGLGGVAARGLGLAARTGQMAAVAPAAAAMGAGEAREKAVAEKATPEQIEKATMLGVAPGLLELAPIERIFSKMPQEIKSGIFDRIKRAFATGGMEGAQEAASAVAQNFIAQQVYKPSQELIEGVGEQAAYGAGAGAIVQFLLDAAIGRRAPSTKPAATPAATPAAAATALTGLPPTAEQTELPLEAPEQPPVTSQAAVAPSGREYTPEEIEMGRMRAETAERKELEAAQVEDQIRELRSTYDILERERARLQAQYDALPVGKADERTKLLEAGQSLYQQSARIEEEIKALRKQATGLSRPGSPYAQREAAAAGQAAFDFEALAPTEAAPVEAPAAPVEAPAAPVEAPAAPLEAPAAPEKSLLERAADVVREQGGKIEAPVSLVQNKLRLGYRTAAKLVSDLTKEGVLSPVQKGPGKKTYREVLPEAPEVAPPAPVQLKEPKKRDRGTGDGREIGGEGARVPVPQPAAGRGVAGTELGGVERAAQPAVLPAGGKKERTAALKSAEEAGDTTKADIQASLEALDQPISQSLYEAHLDYLTQTPEAAEQLAAAGVPKSDLEASKARVAKLTRSVDSAAQARAITRLEKLKDDLSEAVYELERAKEDRQDTRNLQNEVDSLKNQIEKANKEARALGVTPRTKRVGIKHIRKPTGGQSRFSTGDGNVTGNSAAFVAAQIEKAVRDDSALENITTVVQSETQLPEAVRNDPEYKPGVRGVAYRGRVWLVADNIPQGRELGVFLHEAGAHIGFDKVLQPGQREQLANQVRNWAKGDDLKGRAAKVALAKGKDSNDEIIAYAVEELVNRGVKPVSFRPESTWLRRVLDAFKAALKKAGLMQDITPQELVDLAFGAAHIAAKTPVEEGLTPEARFAEKLPATITVGGKQRPTTNSKGQQIHPTEEGVVNFWKWFGDSRVVDAEGRPLVMYHGTSKDVDFKKFKVGQRGAWFTNDPESASSYAATNDSQNLKYDYDTRKYKATNTAARVIPTFLAVKNPATPTAEETQRLRTATNYAKAQRDLFLWYRAKGHDGVDMGGGVVVAFNPNQIKSAIGNVGAFSPTSKDIRFSQGILTDEDRKLFSGAPPAKKLVERAIDAVAGKNLTTTLAGVMQRVRQNMASKYTYWEDYLTALEGNNARDAVGNLSGYDRVMASSKLAGLQQAVLEYGGFGRSPNGMWGAALDENGKFRVPNDNDPSLKKMYRTTYSMVGKYDGIDTADDARTALNMAAAARRESELIKEGLIGPKGEITRSLTDGQIERGLKLYNSMPEIREVLKTFKEINDRGLDALVQAGFMDAETAARYKKAVGYVPWFRFVVDKDGNVNVKALKQFSRGLVNYSTMKDLEGAKIEDIQIDDLLDNVARLSNWMVSKAVGNDTARYMVDAAMHGKQARRVGGFDTKGVDRARTVQVFRNGEPEFYELTDPMAMAAFKGHETAHGVIVGALSVPANVLRKGVTLFPVFPVAQLPQDSVRAFAYSGLKNPYAVFPRIFKNFVKEAFGGTETSKILASRGIYGRGSGTAREEIRSRFAKEIGVDRSLFAKGLEALEKWSDASDLAVRTALYELTMEEGGSEEAAFRRARDIINFDIQGASDASSFLRQTVPFHGVWANDLNNLYKGLVLGKGRLSEGEARQVRNTIVYRGMQLAALTALYTLAVGDEEDYKKLDDATRVRSLIIPGSNIRIPVPGDGIGFMFKVIPEEITRYMLANGIESDDAGAKFGKALFKGLESVGSLENFMPTGLRIPVEMALNKSFYTDNPIVGMSKQKLEAYKQFTETTGTIAKEVGAAVNVSPMKIEYFLRGLTGQIGGFVYGATNALFDALDNKVTPTKKWFERPELRAFTYQSKDRASLDDFYEFREQVDKVARTYNDMIKAGRGNEAIAYLSDPQNKQTLLLRNIQTQMDKDLSAFRQRRKLIYNNQKLTADEMAAQLDALDEAQSRYLKSKQLAKLRAMADVSSKSDFMIQKMFR